MRVSSSSDRCSRKREKKREEELCTGEVRLVKHCLHVSVAEVERGDRLLTVKRLATG